MFEGGVVLVSHDEALICAVATTLYVVGDGRVRRLEGGFADYKRQLLRKMRDKRAASSAAASARAGKRS